MKLIALSLGVVVGLSCLVDSSRGYPRQDMNLGQNELHMTRRLYEDPIPLESPRERRYVNGLGLKTLHTGLSLLDAQEELLDDLDEEAEERVRGTLGRGWQAVRNRFRSGQFNDDADELEDEEDEDEDRERRNFNGLGLKALHTGLSLLDAQEELLDDLDEEAEERVRGTLGRGWQAVRNRFRFGQFNDDADELEDEEEDRKRRFILDVGRKAFSAIDDGSQYVKDLNDQVNDLARGAVRGTLGRGWNAARNRFRSAEDADDIEDEYEDEDEEEEEEE